MLPATLSLEDALALEGLQHRIELAARTAVEAAGRSEVNVDEIVARVRAELASDLAPLEESVAEVNDRIEEAVEAAIPDVEPGPAPDQPAPEPEAVEEPPAPTSEPEPPAASEPEPDPANVEPETQAPARTHFLHRRLGKAS